MFLKLTIDLVQVSEQRTLDVVAPTNIDPLTRVGDAVHPRHNVGVSVDRIDGSVPRRQSVEWHAAMTEKQIGIAESIERKRAERRENTQ